MATIETIEAILVDLPTIRPHVLAMATIYRQTLCVVRLSCSDGITGLGEATTIGGLSYGPEAPETIKLIIDTYLAPLLIGQNANFPAMAMARVDRHVVGNHFAKCALETALLDAQGKRLSIPVSELLGGRRVDSLPVLWTLASGATGSDIAEAERMIELGRHRDFKLKIGKRELSDDVAHVAAIKAALGDRSSVRVDVNMAWDEPTARRGLAMLSDVGCDLVEQPIVRHNREGMARLVALGRLPVMADEALSGPPSALDFARAGAADVFAIKIEQSGGLHAARAVAEIGASAGIGLYGGTMLEGSIGSIASAHAFATFPHLQWGTELFGPLLLTEDIVTEPLTYANFELHLPQGPGLGVTLDADKLACFRRDRTSTQHTLQGA